MPDITIDLQPAIDGLRYLRGDLEAYYWDRPPDGPESSERFQVGYWIRQVSDRSAMLDEIVMHKGSSRLLLREVSAGEVQELDEAVAAVERWVDEGEPFDRVFAMVAAALVAADRIGLHAAAGIAHRG